MDITVKDVKGKSWHIKGIIHGRGLSIKSYDIWVTDPDGNRHHFVKNIFVVPQGNDSFNIIIEIEELGTVVIDGGYFN